MNVKQSYVQKKGHQPKGDLFTFEGSVLQQLIIEFVKERAGVELDLKLDCLDEGYDVYVHWNTDAYEDLDESFTEAQWDAINEIGLNPEEDFLNRDALLQQLFGSEFACATFVHENSMFEVFVPSPQSEKQLAYIQQKGYQPIGEFHVFEESVLQGLMIDFVKEETKLDVELRLSCLDDEYDVFVHWNNDKQNNTESPYTDNQWTVIETVGLHPEDDFINRNILLMRLFETEHPSARFDSELKEYEIFIPHK